MSLLTVGFAIALTVPTGVAMAWHSSDVLLAAALLGDRTNRSDELERLDALGRCRVTVVDDPFFGARVTATTRTLARDPFDPYYATGASSSSSDPIVLSDSWGRTLILSGDCDGVVIDPDAITSRALSRSYGYGSSSLFNRGYNSIDPLYAYSPYDSLRYGSSSLYGYGFGGISRSDALEVCAFGSRSLCDDVVIGSLVGRSGLGFGYGSSLGYSSLGYGFDSRDLRDALLFNALLN